MAIALPPDMSKPVKVSTQGASWRLPGHHAQDLRDVACGLEESDVGIRTRYLFDEEDQSMKPTSFDHTPLHDVEAFCDRFDVLEAHGVNVWRARVRRCRAALRRMSLAKQYSHVAALHVVHGPKDPFVRMLDRQVLDFLGELAPLLRYTQTTEDVRRRLVKEQLARETGLHDVRPQGLSSLARVVSLSDYRERERFAERTTSSGDAVKAALAPFADLAPRPRQDESKSAFDTRQRAFAERSRSHADRRKLYLDGARVDGAAMLTTASRAYAEAWRASAAD